MKELTNIAALILILSFFTNSISFAGKVKDHPHQEEVTVDQCSVKGLFYTVQLGVYSNPIAEENFPNGSKPVYCIKRSDGMYAYFAGVFDNRFDAMAKRYDIVKEGLYEAYVAVYYDGVQITMSEADDLIALHGDAILYNSDKSEFYTEKP